MPEGRIGWQSWSREAFRRAAADDRLILLLITTQWSQGSARMLGEAYGDARVIDAIERRFVPVHVDAEARPDIAERYSLEGWPSTVLLTAEGEILNGVTYADSDSLARLLDRTADLYAAGRASIEARARQARSARRVEPGDEPPVNDAAVPAAIAEALLASAEDAPEGYLDDSRCVHGDALLFLLRYGLVSGDGRALDRVQRTIAALMMDGVFDPESGVGRCGRSVGADVVVERDAATQAAILRVLAEGLELGDDGSWREALNRLAACVGRRWLPRDDAGGPAYTDAVADLAGAALVSAAALDDRALARRALSALEDVALATYRPGHGVSHATGPGAPRLLADHVSVIRTLLDTHELTGELPYSMLAEELGWFVLQNFGDERAGAFVDRMASADPDDDLGRLSEPWYPFRTNALAAHVLACLSRTSGEAEFAEAAATAFAWCASRWRAHGLDAASCGIAALDLIDWRLSSPSGGGRHTT
jgi:uncharacterized protein YyaL (SSP411 family)